MNKQGLESRLNATKPGMAVTSLFPVISFLLLFSLSLQSIPLPIRAQISPLTSLLALAFLPFIVTHIRLTPVFKIVILFAVYTTLHSLVALFIDVTVLGAEEIRILAWARQIVALATGLSVFLVLRRTLVSVSDRFIIRAIVAGSLPALTVALLNVLWGVNGNVIAGDIVTSIRSMLVPLGFTAPSRASGLSLEPSHFAFYLATIVIPVALVAFMVSKRRLMWLLFLSAVLISFVWTISTTGFVVLSGLVLAGILLGPRRYIFASAAVFILWAVIGFIMLFPDNYAVVQVEGLLSGKWGVSHSSRFYSTFGPLINAPYSYVWLGYGLGGTSTHFAEIIPEFAQEDIASVRWHDMPNLSSLIGRLFVETGPIGLSLFAMIIFVSFREAQIKESVDRLRITFTKVSKLAILAFLIGSAMGHGSFALPILWFWLAFIDSRYIKSRETI